MFGRTRLPLKSSDDIRAMRRAGLVTGSALRASALAAHFEHTVAVTERGLWVLTAHDGGRSALGDLYGGLDD